MLLRHRHGDGDTDFWPLQLWKLYTSAPIGTSAQIREQRKLQQSYLKVRRDLNATSSQDEFAKWAKLRRQHDKLLEELEKKSTSAHPSSPQRKMTGKRKHPKPLSTQPVLVGHRRKLTLVPHRGPPLTESGIDMTKASFDKTVTTVRWLSTTGARYFLPFWYSREPMLWLPHGWFPYYAEWLISFPRAPLGSVSVASWQLACTGVVTLVADALGAAAALVLDARRSYSARQKERPVAAADTATTEKTGAGAEAAPRGGEKESKKDL